MQLEHAGWASVSREGEGHSGCYDNFAMVFSQGPIVLMRIELGVYSKGRLTVCELMMEYLRHKQLHQVGGHFVYYYYCCCCCCCCFCSVLS